MVRLQAWENEFVPIPMEAVDAEDDEDEALAEFQDIACLRKLAKIPIQAY